MTVTDTFATSMQLYPSQTSTLNRDPSFDKDNLICHMGAFTKLKPTYTLLLFHTSWSSIPCSIHSLALQTLDIPNHMAWATKSGILEQ